ncbi:hypothetical protein ACP4OV_011876 [Aristida adscensionis]
MAGDVCVWTHTWRSPRGDDEQSRRRGEEAAGGVDLCCRGRARPRVLPRRGSRRRRRRRRLDRSPSLRATALTAHRRGISGEGACARLRAAAGGVGLAEAR